MNCAGGWSFIKTALHLLKELKGWVGFSFLFTGKIKPEYFKSFLMRIKLKLLRLLRATAVNCYIITSNKMGWRKQNVTCINYYVKYMIECENNDTESHRSWRKGIQIQAPFINKYRNKRFRTSSCYPDHITHLQLLIVRP